MKKKIKVLHAAVKAGGGHIALRDFLHKTLDEDEEHFRNVSFTHPGEALETADTLINNMAPILYELTYFFSPRYMSDFSWIATFNFLRECYKVLKQEKPDVVLSTHFILSLHFSFAKRILRSDAIIVNCIPDYGPPSKIMHPKLKPFRSEKLLVFENWTRKGAAEQFKIPEQEVLLAGYNPKQIFANTATKYTTKKDARIQLKKVLDYNPYTSLDPDKTTVLVSAGAVDGRKTIKLLKQIAKLQKSDPNLVDRYQFLVITGRDMKYFERLSKYQKDKREWSNVYPVAWVDPSVYSLIQYSCDFPLLGGIAPATLNELLISECGPLIVFRTRPGQELAHRAFIEEKGLGRYMPEFDDLAQLLQQGIDQDERDRFINNGKAFRQEQSQRAAELPAMIRSMYESHKEKRAD